MCKSIALLLFLFLQLLGRSYSFLVVLSRTTSPSESRTNLRMSQWSEDEAAATSKAKGIESDQKASTQSVSFDDAGDTLRNLEDKDLLDSAEDFDSNSKYNSESLDRIRAAIKERTESLGIQKSIAAEAAVKEAEERARQAIMNQRSGDQNLLDLTQITESSRTAMDDSASPIDDVFFDNFDELTDDEKAEADPTGVMPFLQQIQYEVKESEWPTILDAVKQVIILALVVGLSGVGIVSTDQALRDFYVSNGLLPKQDETILDKELILPDGWTNNMSEDDYMSFKEEVAKQGVEVVQSTKTLMDDINEALKGF